MATVSQLWGPLFPREGSFHLHQLFQELLYSREDLSSKTAITCDGSSMTFQELQKAAQKLSSRLISLMSRSGVTANSDGDRIVAVCMEPCLELIVVLLAVFQSGAAYLPLDLKFPPERIEHILRDSRPVFCVVREVPETLSAIIGKETLVIDYGEPGADNLDEQSLDLADNQLAAVLYTSGSTGTPKGVRLEHRTIASRLKWQWKCFPFQDGEVACFKTALTFVDSIAEIWAPLLQGVPLVIVRKENLQNVGQFVNILEEAKISRLVLVPSLLSAILFHVKNGGKKLLQNLKLWICSGETLPAALVLEFFDCFGESGAICNFYGSTEVMGDVTYAVFRSRNEALSSLFDNKLPIGFPVDNCGIYLLDKDTQLMKSGDVGEIFVAGHHVASGYVNRREAHRFVPNPFDEREGLNVLFRTGDFGRIVGEVLYYEGRADSQVKVRGHRVDVTEINAVVKKCALVKEAVVLCYKAGLPEQEIVAFVVTAGEFEVLEIQKELRGKLMSYMMPRVLLVEDIPLLVNGKVDRQKLLGLYEASLCKEQASDCDFWEEAELENYTPELQVKFISIFKTVIGVVGCSLNTKLKPLDNFFEVGGNSLNAVIVATKLRDQGFQIDIGDFLSAKTFLELAEKLLISDELEIVDNKCKTKYIMEFLTPEVKSSVTHIISKSFSEKGELELLTGVTYEDYVHFMDDIWEPLLAANLSFVLKSAEGKVVAVALNFDVFDEPPVQPEEKRLIYVFEFLEHLEAPIRESRFQKREGNVLHSFMMGTEASLTSAENIELIRIMEEETLLLAKQRGFCAVFTTNSNELTRQICDDILDYEILHEFQVNQYIAEDGSQPFADAPDSQLSVVTVKYIRDVPTH